jgi:hypothetical protein
MRQLIMRTAGRTGRTRPRPRPQALSRAVRGLAALCGRPGGGKPCSLTTLPKRLTRACPVALDAGSILMSAEQARLVAPLMSAVSPVRSLLATRPPGGLRHDRAAPARRRALPLSGCLPGWRAGCPATPETGPACPPATAPHQPTVPVDCADRQADGIGQPPGASSAQPRQQPCAAPCRPRIARRGSRRDRRGVVVLASGLDIS